MTKMATKKIIMTKITKKIIMSKNDQKDYNGQNDQNQCTTRSQKDQNDQKISKFIKAFFWKGGKIVYVKYKVQFF